MLMKDKFLSKAVPRGTRTIWRYLSALFILFTFAIGNVWGAVIDLTPDAEVTGTNKKWKEVGGGYVSRNGGGFTISTDGLQTGSGNTYVVFDVAAASTIEAKFINTSTTAYSDKTICCGKVSSTQWTAITNAVSDDTQYQLTIASGDKLTDQTISLPGTKSATTSCTFTATAAGKYAVYWTSSINNKVRLYEIEITASCDATAPGNISKGALSAGILTLQVADDPKTGDEFYWQTSATGTTKNKTGENINFGKTYQVSAAGTYYIRSYNVAGDCWSDAKSFEVKATDLVANYTVIYKDGTTELGSETVEVGQHPTATAITTTKEFYTFAAWQESGVDKALEDVSAADGETVTLTARYTAQYTSGTYEFTGNLTMGTDPQMTIENNTSGKPYSAGRIDNIYVSAQTIGYEATGDYGGWKLKTTNGTLRFLVENTCGIRVTIGEANPLRINYTEGGTAKSADIAKSTTSAIYKADANSLVTLTNFTASNKTVTLKKIEILPLYTAIRVDGKSDASGSDANVLETTLPTPTAISGWTFTGWTANEDVKAGEDTKTAGTVLAAGTYTLLANTTFTAQWAEATATYDVTYVSAHGTAPDAENAASVVLAELSETGWAHKGWTANVDVTVDAATVEAGTLIANGKTAILASDVEFTAVWKEIFTVTFDSKDGSAVAPIDVEDGATLAAAPSAPTKDNYVFQGWSETDGGAVVADITAITISDDKTFYAIWALDVQVSEIVFSNSFKGWIHDGQVEVFYMAGESAPTITSYAGKNLKAEGGVVISDDKIIATGTDDSEVEFALTMTEVTPLATTGAQNFDGSEGYVKTRHAWTAERKWKLSRYATDGRVARGETSLYIFLGTAESVTLDWGAQKVTDDVAVYVNGTFVKNVGKNNNSAIELSNGNNMVALYSLQTSGDIWLNGLTVAPWVPVETVTLKEGEAEISSKEIWESTSFTLTAEVTPDNASDKTITWTSSNNDVATVVNGVVTGVAANATPVTITASTVDGVTATCAVTVTAAPEPCETPVITAQPASQVYCAGGEPTLTVAANDPSDGGTLHYAWFKDDAAIGTDAATCVVDGAGTYKVVVTNHVDGKLDASVTSSNAVVTMNVAAAITTQPTGKVEVVSGSEVTLSVVATNATSYQWYICDDAEKANASAISGAEAEDYVFTCTANAYYYCVVGNACGEDIESNVVAVKLQPEGCNTFASIPAAEPYNYEQTGEWTFYYVDSNGADKSTDNVFAEGKNFDDEDVVVANTRRFALKFAKDVESVTLYGVGGDKSFTKVSVSNEMVKNTYTELTTTATRADVTDKNHIFTVDNVIIPADKYAWFEFSGSLNFFKICYTTAIEKPVITAQPVSNTNYESGVEMSASVSVNPVSEGTLSYQWYNAADDSEVDGATTATLTTLVDGVYYVIVTNKLAGHKDYAVKSETATLAHRDATDATLSALGYGDPVTAIALVADKYEYRVDLAEGTTDVPALSATATKAGYANVAITNAAAFDNYEAISTVLVTAEDGTTQKEYTVHFYVDHAIAVLVDVTDDITWDFSKANDGSAAGSNLCNEEIFANVAGIVNNGDFESDNLIVTANKFSSGKLQASMIKFHSTVDGVIKVVFSNTGNKEHFRYLVVNGVQTEVGSKSGTAETYYGFVPAGDVVLTVTTADGGNMFNFTSVKFIKKDAVDFARDAAHGDDWMAPGELGTICIEHGAVATGGDVFELVGKNEVGKIAFASVSHMEPGKPYLFQAKSNAMNFYYTDETEASEPDNSGAMKGSFTNYTLYEVADVYYFAGQALWLVDADHLDVIAHRAYVKMNDVEPISGASSMPGRRYIMLGVNGENQTQGFDNLESGETPMKVMIDGTLYIIRGEKVFDATGRLVK